MVVERGACSKCSSVVNALGGIGVVHIMGEGGVKGIMVEVGVKV